jgi:hypothetical protein
VAAVTDDEMYARTNAYWLVPRLHDGALTIECLKRSVPHRFLHECPSADGPARMVEFVPPTGLCPICKQWWPNPATLPEENP